MCVCVSLSVGRWVGCGCSVCRSEMALCLRAIPFRVRPAACRQHDSEMCLCLDDSCDAVRFHPASSAQRIYDVIRNVFLCICECLYSLVRMFCRNPSPRVSVQIHRLLPVCETSELCAHISTSTLFEQPNPAKFTTEIQSCCHLRCDE